MLRFWISARWLWLLSLCFIAGCRSQVAVPISTPLPTIISAPPAAASMPAAPSRTSITQLTATDGPATPTSAPPTSLAELDQAIVFVAADGATLQRIIPGSQTVPESIITIAKTSDQVISHLSADPLGRFLLYGLSPLTPSAELKDAAQYGLIQANQQTPIGQFTLPPRWSADGRLVGQAVDQTTGTTNIAIYDPPTNTLQRLPVDGIPNWTPGQPWITYASGGAVLVYDLKRQESTIPLVTTTDWTVQVAQDYPDRTELLAYASTGTTLIGPTYNWYRLPIDYAAPKPLIQSDGYQVSDNNINPEGDLWAYAETLHAGACGSIDRLHIRPLAAPEQALPLKLPDLAENDRLYLHGLKWTRGGFLVFSAQPYRCNDTNTPELGEPAIYVWQVTATGSSLLPAPIKLGLGTQPVWVDE